MKKKLNNEYLDSFLDNIWAEQGLAKNTLLSYEHDINSFLTFIDKKKIKKILLSKNDKVEIVHFIGGG